MIIIDFKCEIISSHYSYHSLLSEEHYLNQIQNPMRPEKSGGMMKYIVKLAKSMLIQGAPVSLEI